jgi:hypothetical protein
MGNDNFEPGIRAAEIFGDYQTKPWPQEALIEGWFPIELGEQHGLKFCALAGTRDGVNTHGPDGSPEDASMIGSANTDESKAGVGSDKPGAQMTGATAERQEVRRTGEVRLDTHFHRRNYKPDFGSPCHV